MNVTFVVFNSNKTAPSSSMLNQVSIERISKDGLNTISVFSHRQQRKMKLLFLKASRPIISKVKNKTSEKSMLGSTSLSSEQVDDHEDTMASCSDSVMPLTELAAFEEARRRRMIKSEGDCTPIVSAVDWMLQGAPYEWPMFSWLKEAEKTGRVNRKIKDDVLVRVTVSPVKEKDYPRCKWPRQVMALPSPVLEPETTVKETEEENLYPRCSWPRPAAPAAMSTTVEIQQAPNAVQYPRCEWPRKSNLVGEVTKGVEEVKVLERIYASEANIGYAHCAWPRKPTLKAKVEVPTESPEVVAGPRCPWPRQSIKNA